MSPRARRWGARLGQVAVTTAAVLYVLGRIQWHDRVAANPGSAPGEEDWRRGEAREVRVEGSQVVVVWTDGPATRHAPGDVKVLSRGFFSLFERTRKGLFYAMAALLLVPLFLCALRWWLLLRAHGFPAPLGRVFFVTYAGAFFNHVLPGAVGGDIAKAVLAASGEDRKAAVVGTVILDRLIGLAVMIVLGAACLTPFVGRFQDRRLAILVYGLLAGMLAVYLLYFSGRTRGLVGERLPFRATMGQLDAVFRSAREKKGLMAAAAGLSVLAQASAILIIFGLSRAMGLTGAELWTFFVFEPVIFIGTALPISLGGLGVQEFLYESLFGTFTAMSGNEAIALSVLYKLSGVLVSVPGGVLFAMGATRRPPAGNPSPAPSQ